MKYTMSLIRALVLASAGLLPVSVQAHYILDECLRNPGSANESVMFPDITLNSGRDVPVGEAFGPWFTHTLTWTCTRTLDHHPVFWRPNDYFHAKTWVYATGVEDRGLYAADPSFRVYSFGAYNVGFIVQVIQRVKNGETHTLTLNTPVGNYWDNEQYLKGSVARQVGDVSEFQLELKIRLVKLDGPPLPAPTATVHFTPLHVDFFSSMYHKDNDILLWKHHSAYYYSLTTTVKQIAATCKTFGGNTIKDQTVQLGTVPAHTLINDGFGPDTGFKLRFQECPPGMTDIRYEFQPLPAGTTPVNGILLQMATGTAAASGVGVQVRDENNQPLNFNQPLSLTAYDPNASSPADYVVPLKARIIRTGATVSGGSVEAAMNVTVTYK